MAANTLDDWIFGPEGCKIEEMSINVTSRKFTNSIQNV